MNKNINKIVSLSLMVGILTLSGCALFKNDQGNPDPVRIKQVEEAIKLPVAIAVERVVRKNPDFYAYFEAVDNVVCKMEENKNFDPTYLVDQINLSTQHFIKNEDVNLVKETVVTLYKIFYADRLKSDIPENSFLSSLTSVLCSSIKTGLSNSGIKISH